MTQSPVFVTGVTFHMTAHIIRLAEMEYGHFI